jgi:hypothetical protein
MTVKIKLRARERFLERGVDIPGYIWQEAPFPFKPHPFAVGSDRLNDRIFNPDVQIESHDRFLENPTENIIYGVASAPSDQRAKFFAAHLVQTFLDRAPPNVTVRWENLYSSFSNPALDAQPSLLVITGLNPNALPVKLEKARELLEKHWGIPRIVVIAGEDPVTFFSTRLYCSVNSIYFHSSTMVKRKVEVL